MKTIEYKKHTNGYIDLECIANKRKRIRTLKTYIKNSVPLLKRALPALCALLLTITAHAATIPINYGALALVESSGGINTYNKHTGATGIYQIRQIAVDDYNQYHTKKYRLHDMYNESKAFIVADWLLGTRFPQLLRHYGAKVTLETVLQAYNLGAKAYAVRGDRNARYVAKYKNYCH